VGQGHTPGFERPDVDELRHALQRPSIWSRLVGFVVRILTNRTMYRTLLVLLILAALIGGFWLLSR
jgi:hypothetical protein